MAHPAWHEWNREMTRVDGLDVHYVAAGDSADPLVLLLHGFPEFWYAWRHQLPALADAGYYAVAPDMRGYNESGKPDGVESYAVAHLVDDVAGLVEQFGAADPLLIGHDWGGVVAWETAIRRPDVPGKLAVLNAPHPGAYLRELRRNPAQLRRSWYALCVQLPRLPEWLLARADYAALDRLFDAAPGAFTPADRERYKDAAAKRGALTAALDYYRANGSVADPATWLRLRDLVPPLARDATVEVPTLVLWGERDPALAPGLADVGPWVPDCRVERFPEAGHWLPAERPEATTAALLSFGDA